MDDLNKFVAALPDLHHMAVQGLITLIILVVGWTLSSLAAHGVRRLASRSTRIDPTVVPILRSVTVWTIRTVVLLAVLARLGVQTASLIAMLGAAGLAVGLALQGTLQNIAAGIMLLILRPVRAGEYVSIAGQGEGTVDEVGLFMTRLIQFDGVHLLLPNSSVWGNAVINYSRNASRRLDVAIGVRYGDDLDQAIAALRTLVEGRDDVLPDPAPRVMATEYRDSAVMVNIRVWTPADKYWDLRFDLYREAAQALQRAGLKTPIPLREVRAVPGTAPAPSVFRRGGRLTGLFDHSIQAFGIQRLLAVLDALSQVFHGLAQARDPFFLAGGMVDKFVQDLDQRVVVAAVDRVGGEFRGALGGALGSARFRASAVEQVLQRLGRPVRLAGQGRGAVVRGRYGPGRLSRRLRGCPGRRGSLGRTRFLACMRVVLEDDARRVAHRRCAWRHGFDHHGVRADAGVRADREAAQDLGARADHHALLEGGVALFALVQTGAAQGDALVDGAVVAHDGGLADDDAESVVDEDPPADLRAGVDFDAGEDAAQVRDEPPRPQPAAAPQSVGQPVHQDGVQPRITGEDLEAAACRRVALVYAVDVFA